MVSVCEISTFDVHLVRDQSLSESLRKQDCTHMASRLHDTPTETITHPVVNTPARAGIPKYRDPILGKQSVDFFTVGHTDQTVEKRLKAFERGKRS